MKISACVAVSLLALFTWFFAGCGSSSGSSVPGSVSGTGSSTSTGTGAGTTGGGSSGGSTGSGGSGGSTTGGSLENALVLDYSMSGSSAPTEDVQFFSVNTTSGLLQNFGSLLIGPEGYANVNPAGTFVVLTSVFGVTSYATHGAAVPTKAFTTQNAGAGVEISLFQDGGQFLYTGGLSTGIGAFSLDSSGNVTPVPGLPFTPGGWLLGLTPKFLYVLTPANGGSDPFSSQNINVFAVDPSTGALTLQPGSTTAIASVGHTTGNPSERWLASAFTHSGRFLFLGDHTTGTVYSYALDASTGTPMLVSTITVGALPPTAMTLSRDDQHVYVAEGQDIVGLTVNSSGALAPLNGGNALASIPPTVAQGSGPSLMTGVLDVEVDLTGNFLYVLTPDQIFGFDVNPGTGTLAPNSGADIIRSGAPTGRPWGQINFGNMSQ